MNQPFFFSNFVFFIFVQRSLTQLLQLDHICSISQKIQTLKSLKSNYQSNIIKKRLKIIFCIYYFFPKQRIKSQL